MRLEFFLFFWWCSFGNREFEEIIRERERERVDFFLFYYFLNDTERYCDRKVFETLFYCCLRFKLLVCVFICLLAFFHGCDKMKLFWSEGEETKGFGGGLKMWQMFFFFDWGMFWGISTRNREHRTRIAVKWIKVKLKWFGLKSFLESKVNVAGNSRSKIV